MKYVIKFCRKSIVFTGPFINAAQGKCETVISRMKINLNAEEFLKKQTLVPSAKLYRISQENLLIR